ncbi:MAG: epoxyqueuosine reductase QueH [Alphaproteobacteria bacterium]|nr:epoxyqueuosine reductase QueH [Alphaproteobacteria bacterium]
MAKKRMLLVSCCAPCSIGVIYRLKEQGVDFSVLFYNPNIQPELEYRKRCEENKRICFEQGVPFIELPYEPDVWKKTTTGLENEPERGNRCRLCFKLRLQRAAQYAKQNGFDVFSSVLGISRFKNFDQVCAVAQEVSESENIPYDMTNWRKNGGLEFAEKLGKEKNLYRQTYCGCKPR